VSKSDKQRGRPGLPDHWANALVRAGFRTGGGRYNASAFTRALKAASGDQTWPSPNTVLDLIYARRATRPDPKLVALMAQVLGVERDVVARWANPERPGSAPWVPPAASSLLTGQQRRALDRLVEVMVADVNGDDVDGDGSGDTAPMNEVDALETTAERRGRMLRVSTNVRPIRGDGQPRTGGSGGARKRQPVTDGDGGDDT